LPVRKIGLLSISWSKITAWFEFFAPRDASPIRSPAAHEVEVVVEQGGSLLGGDPVEELEGADPRLHLVRGHDRLRDLVVVARCRFFSKNDRHHKCGSKPS